MKIAEDGLSASLIIPASIPREQLTRELIHATLLRFGVELAATSPERIESALAEAKTHTDGSFETAIARGTPPSHGKDGWVQWLIDEKKNPSKTNSDTGESSDQEQSENDQPVPGADDAKEPVSFYDRSAYTVVKTGDVLGKLHQPTFGSDGRDVTGKNLASRDGKAIDFKHDESLMLGREGEIIAQANGVLDRTGKTFAILDTIEVDKYIDFETGNIEFNGSVVVRKGVRDCFKVQADKDIEVHGLIEAATIKAGGELRALGGFAGRDQGVAEARGNVCARYLDAVRTMTRKDLCVDREIINCITTVLGKISSPTGAIIGGETRVAGSIEVAELGADGLPTTTLYLGGVPHLDPLIDQLAVLTEKLVAERQKLVDEQEMIQKASGGRLAASHQERICELLYEIAEVQSSLDRAEPALEQARKKADEMRQVDVQVHRCMFPNTVLLCNGMRYRIKDEMRGPLRITMDTRGHLQTQKGTEPPTKLARNAELTDAA